MNSFLPQDVVDKISATFFRLPHQGLNDRDINIAITHLYDALCHDFSYISPRLRHERETPSTVLDFTSPSRVIKQKMKSKFRVGFVSSHFFHHSIGRMLIEVVHFMMDAIATEERFRHFEIYAFFMKGPTQTYDDELTAAFENVLKGEIHVTLSSSILRYWISLDDYCFAVMNIQKSLFAFQSMILKKCVE